MLNNGCIRFIEDCIASKVTLRYMNVVSEKNEQCLEAAQQEFHRSLLGVIEADNQTTTDTE